MLVACLGLGCAHDWGSGIFVHGDAMVCDGESFVWQDEPVEGEEEVAVGFRCDGKLYWTGHVSEAFAGILTGVLELPRRAVGAVLGLPVR